MSTPILATKLYITPPRPEAVFRSRLIERLNRGLHRRLTLISAPAGFGKTTLMSEWVTGCQQPVAWLSLDEEDNDPTRFLVYLITTLQTITANFGEGIIGVLQSPQPPPTKSILTTLLNEITTIADNFILVLDDYHVVDTKPVDDAITFLLDHLPQQMHLVIATRVDPQLPLARLRARGQLTELRVADLRFTASETTGFLNQTMGLNLSADDITALETRTEGWIAGLQLAGISMQGHKDVTSFIKSFTGSHHFVMDYLVEEVLQQQSESVQNFLLHTSVLDRFCGPLCDAILNDSSDPGQETLEYLEQTNLFIIPLDNERSWYRYHHLFADLLRQRLHLLHSTSSSTGDEGRYVAELHIRASRWYEKNGMEVEAFRHATIANDVELAMRLMEGDGMPLPFRGEVVPVLNWLKSLSHKVLDAWPLLWVTYASTSLSNGQQIGVEEKLQAAEYALRSAEPDDMTKDLVGRIAATRATMAIGLNQVDTIIEESRRALGYLHPDNLAFRTSTTFKLGFAYQLQGDRAAASQAYNEVISIGQASGNIIFTVTATICLGRIQETENQLYQAAQTYRRSLEFLGDLVLPITSEAHLGLARVSYEWNDLDAAQKHAQESIRLLQQIESLDTFAECAVFLVRLKLALGDVAGATATIAEADQFVRQHDFVSRIPDIAAAQVMIKLYQGNLTAAAQLANEYELPISRARVLLAQGDSAAALAILETSYQQTGVKGWEDEQLRLTVLHALALHAHGEKDEAAKLIGDALILAEPGGFIRIFVDEGVPMVRLISEAAGHGIKPDYISKLLTALSVNEQKSAGKPFLPATSPTQPLIEPLSQRELEVLNLIGQGLSNQEICGRLFLALSTVKGHNRNIFGKLQVQRRTEAVARARELGLL